VQTMKEIAPSTTQLAVIFNPETAPFYRSFLPFIDNAARLLGVRQMDTPVHDVSDIERTLVQLQREPNTGLIVIPSALFTTASDEIFSTVARFRLPAIYSCVLFRRNGGFFV